MFTRSLNQTAVAPQSPSAGLLREIYEDTRARREGESGRDSGRQNDYNRKSASSLSDIRSQKPLFCEANERRRKSVNVKGPFCNA